MSAVKTLADQHALEVSTCQPFRFGPNWARLLKRLNLARIAETRRCRLGWRLSLSVKRITEFYERDGFELVKGLREQILWLPSARIPVLR